MKSAPRSVRQVARLGREGVALLPVLLALAWLFRRLLAGWVLAGGDLQLYFFPYWVAAARAFQAGRLPLWNPDLFAGAPLLANSQAGVFYPLNWPLWLLAGPTLPGVTQALHASVVLHVLLAAVAAYALARRLGLSRSGAAFAALLYGGGGFVGVHVEHLNQLQGLAWLPLALLPDRKSAAERAFSWPSLLNVTAYALILLAGHTQTAFIAAVGIVVFRVVLWFWPKSVPHDRQPSATPEPQAVHSPKPGGEGLLLSLAPFALAGLLAAVQLAPMLELSRFSPRAGGLPWREAVSFSFVPWEAPHVLLPAYLFAPALPEGVAYVGVLGLLLAGWGAVQAVRSRQRHAAAAGILAGVGLLLALGAYNPLYLLAARLGLPGVIQFRAPARFLALYALGTALLAGFGVEMLPWPWKRGAALHGVRWLLFGALAVELALSAEQLPHAHATPARAYSDLRPATAHLVAAAREAEAQRQPPGRFLSISRMLFEPGDKGEIESLYGSTLDADALWAYLVAAKAREVLAPNLPLAFAVPAADGYDGGVLPLRHYADFTTLLLPEGTLDGRLRENLEAIPDTRWLELLDVRFLITDKVGDLWAEGVFYDRQFQPELAPGATLTLAWLPANFAADGVGLLFSGAGTLEVTLTDGRTLALPLVSSEGETPQQVRWPDAVTLRRLTVRAGEGGLRLTGATLVETATDAFYPLTLSERFRLAHSGDVKIYEAVTPSARAVLVHEIACVADTAAALAALRAPDFDPATRGVLVGCPAEAWPGAASPASPVESVQVLAYAAERVELAVRAEAPGVLVLKDAWYPGWQVTVAPLRPAEAAPVFEGEPLRAQVLFRAVPVPAGEWRVTFVYQPPSLWVGAALSVLGILATGGYVLWRGLKFEHFVSSG